MRLLSYFLILATSSLLGTPSIASAVLKHEALADLSTMTVTQRVAHLKYKLPDETPAAGDYVPFTILPLTPQCTLIFTSGMGSVFTKGEVTTKIQGQVPTKVSSEQAQKAAEFCALRHIAAFQKAGLNLDEIVPLELTCFINSASGYGELPKITDAASKVIRELFGKSIARTTVGTGLPLNYTVEIRGTYALVSKGVSTLSDNKQPQYRPIKVQPAGYPTVFSDNLPDPKLVFHATPVAPRRPIPPAPNKTNQDSKEAPQSKL